MTYTLRRLIQATDKALREMNYHKVLKLIELQKSYLARQHQKH